jgi:hypothetical protein
MNKHVTLIIEGHKTQFWIIDTYLTWGFVWPYPEEPECTRLREMICGYVDVINKLPPDQELGPTFAGMNGIELFKQLMGTT